MEKECLYCGKLFIAKTPKSKYCCEKCRAHGSGRYKRTIEEIRRDYAEFQSKAVDLYNQGYLTKEIAELLGRDYGFTGKALREAGIRYEKKKKIIYAQVMRFCKVCNDPFLCDPRSNKIFCSKTCEKRCSHLRNDVVRRSRKRAAIVDRDISLEKVCEKDNGLCWLCGGAVDWNDYQLINGKRFAGRMYPSVDHVIPLKQGGAHSWENVRLAHFSCNASKGEKVVSL